MHKIDLRNLIDRKVYKIMGEVDYKVKSRLALGIQMDTRHLSLSLISPLRVMIRDSLKKANLDLKTIKI